MRFDLFYELSLPPALKRNEAQTYQETVDEIVWADQLGFGCAWFVEHHFMRHYSHCPKPELILAALSQCTHVIRLGHAIIPLPYHHPVHVAERVASLDILSGGRLEVGIGRGFSPQEYAVFGQDMAASRSLLQESLDILRLSFLDQPVSFNGKHYQLQQVDIIPRVVQIPHPPLWSAAVSPDTFKWAAREKLGVLIGPFKPWWMARHDIKEYLGVWTASSPPRVGMTIGVLCLEDGKRAKKLARSAFTWFYKQLYKVTLPVLESVYPSYEHLHELGRFRHLLAVGIKLSLLETFGMVVVGSPQECTQQLEKYRTAGVTHLLCAMGAGALPTEVVRESMHCFAQRVIPHFKAD